MAKITGRESDQFNLRFPDGMRDRLKEEAAMNGRSLNAEIIHRIQTTLDMDTCEPGESVHIDKGELVIGGLNPREKLVVAAIVQAIKPLGIDEKFITGLGGISADQEHRDMPGLDPSNWKPTRDAKD